MAFPPPQPPFPALPPAPSRVDDVARAAKFLRWQGLATLAWATFCTAAAAFLGYTVLIGGGGSDGPMVTALYVVFGVGSWIAGILQLVASGRMRAFQSRGLCFVALWSNVASFFCGGSICCLPTGIPVIVYGMTVLMEPSVIAAFERAKHSPPSR